MLALVNKCHVSAAWHPSTGTPEPENFEFTALWDTGATHSVISQACVDACGLAPTGVAQVRGVHGQQTRPTFLVNIILPDAVVMTGVRVTLGELGGADLLIGMDIITQGDFSVTNAGGTTKFSFRIPSMEHIDYAAQATPTRAANIPSPSRAERRRQKFNRQ